MIAPYIDIEPLGMPKGSGHLRQVQPESSSLVVGMGWEIRREIRRDGMGSDGIQY